jgi:RNase adapter protein RapZ
MERRLIVVTGLSGAGKTVVLNALKDLDYYCIDNLPIGLLIEFCQHIWERYHPFYQYVAAGIDARNPRGLLAKFPNILHDLGSPELLTAELVFVEATEETLVRRFSETRRKHPLSSERVSLAEAIDQERQLLGSLCEQADLRIDTSRTSVNQLWNYVKERVARRPKATLSLQLTSFGFKQGVPRDADFVFDVRCLPNPHWETHLRHYSGRDAQVIAFLEQSPRVSQMIQSIASFLDRWIPTFEAENRSYLTVAIGCTGGYHRSIYIVDRLSTHFSEQGKKILVSHRDM